VSGHVQPRGKGTWRLFVDNGRDPLTGRRRRITRTFQGTKKEAEREAERLVVSVRDGRHGAAVTTFGALIDAWLEHAEPNLAPWTVRGYRSKVETHIRPALGTLKLRRLTTARLDEFYRELLKRGRREILQPTGGEARTVEHPLSPQSVRHVHAIIHRACEQGRRWGWLDRNPAELAEPPTVEPREANLPPIGAILTDSEKLTVDMRELVWAAIITGARRGELCGLRWTDVDLDAGQVTIARSIADTPGRLIVKGTKTGKTRRLAIDAVTVAIFRERHARHAEKALACGVPLDPVGYVFSDTPGAGDPLRPALVSKRWANAAKAAHVKCRFHDLRHLGITELLEAGFEVGGVAKRVGHASTKMTQDVYQHARRAGDLAASEHLAGLLEPRITTT
jgi:integrase